MEDAFFKFMKDNRLSDNTCNSYISDLKKFKEYYFDSYGEDLQILIHADIITYRTYLQKHNSTYKTINRKLAALKQYNLFLIDQKKQDTLAIQDKDYYKIQQSIIPKKIPSQQEINRLKHFASRDEKKPKRDYCFISIFKYVVLRLYEILNIRLIDIKLEDRFINIIGKGNKFRQIVINSIMYDAISEYLEERKEIQTNNPYLFIGQKNKNNTKPLNRNFCNRLLNKYKDICNIKDLHPHMLRAYFCTNALHNAGYSIDQVANQAGHYSLNTTKGYLSTDQESIISLADKL